METKRTPGQDGHAHDCKCDHCYSFGLNGCRGWIVSEGNRSEANARLEAETHTHARFVTSKAEEKRLRSEGWTLLCFNDKGALLGEPSSIAAIAKAEGRA